MSAVSLAKRAEMDLARLRDADLPAVTLTPASAICPRPIDWLWRGWLARGKLHILAGAPGTGKTTIALALAAIVSRGARWPDGTMASAGNVLLWSGEDDAADTLVPRLGAAGADCDRIFIVGDTPERGGRRAFDPATDLAALEYEAARIGDVALLIADPVVSAVTGDSHKNTEVRRALQPMVNLGHRLGCAVLGVSHFSKGTAGRDPLERVTGSVAFGALARIVLVTANGGDGRLMARAKSNIGPDGGGYGYGLELVETAGIEASRIAWGAPLEGTARELLGEFEPVGDSPRGEAAEWLQDMLAGGEVPVKVLRAEATGAGLTWRTVERAKSEIGVIAERVTEGNCGKGHWRWRLPGKTANGKAANPNTRFGGLTENKPQCGFQGEQDRKTANTQGDGLTPPEVWEAEE
ncbi:MAG: AAA family ATPase [Gammaproteobacteria bacterium]